MDAVVERLAIPSEATGTERVLRIVYPEGRPSSPEDRRLRGWWRVLGAAANAAVTAVWFIQINNSPDPWWRLAIAVFGLVCTATWVRAAVGFFRIDTRRLRYTGTVVSGRYVEARPGRPRCHLAVDDGERELFAAFVVDRLDYERFLVGQRVDVVTDVSRTYLFRIEPHRPPDAETA